MADRPTEGSLVWIKWRYKKRLTSRRERGLLKEVENGEVTGPGAPSTSQTGDRAPEMSAFVVGQSQVTLGSGPGQRGISEHMSHMLTLFFLFVCFFLKSTSSIKQRSLVL